jgi:hypothetical protein
VNSRVSFTPIIVIFELKYVNYAQPLMVVVLLANQNCEKIDQKNRQYFGHPKCSEQLLFSILRKN